MSKHKPVSQKTPAEREAYNARKRAEAAARRDLAGTAEIPKDHRLKGVSVLTDKNGNLDRRWDKSERDSTPEGELPETPPDFAITKQSRFTDAQGKVRAMWTAFEQTKVEQEEAFRKVFDSYAAEYQFRAPEITYTGYAAPNVHNVIPIGDAHVGLLAHIEETGANYDLRIAERELITAVDLLIDMAPPADSCNIVNLGDWFHAQDDNQLTPRGKNKQDVDGRIFKILRLSLSMIERMIERALGKFKRVTFTMVPGNHDPHMALVFSVMLERIMRDNPRVHVPSNLDSCIVDEFGDCMFLYNHTDKMKMDRLVRVMAARYASIWGRTKHRYVHGGHVHHSEVKEDIGAVCESHNTMAGSDKWHRDEGYDSRKLCKIISYHKTFGEIGRHVVTRERVLAHLETVGQ